MSLHGSEFNAVPAAVNGAGIVSEMPRLLTSDESLCMTVSGP